MHVLAWRPALAPPCSRALPSRSPRPRSCIVSSARESNRTSARQRRRAQAPWAFALASYTHTCSRPPPHRHTRRRAADTEGRGEARGGEGGRGCRVASESIQSLSTSTTEHALIPAAARPPNERCQDTIEEEIFSEKHKLCHESA
ncbi:hypothetical protein R5R35_003219 [Gryllus longicercus]|uniref:Uncharacterized protein n=1 Tax=Gryllus longicercus TaxID=2509291 RepID=A0AAN9VLI9_9ORTH